MLVSNNSYAVPQSFILNGIPGLEALHTWISLPFCTMYIISLVGNFGLVYLIYYEESLHRPMYFFLAMLSLVDLFTCTTTLPNALFIFWFKLKEISFTACLVQMFFVHGFTGVESGVLMLMALDRYVAICYPLRYATILTNSVMPKLGLPPSWEVCCWWFLFHSWLSVCPSAKAMSSPTPIVTTCLWWSYPVLASKSMSFMVSWLHSWLVCLTFAVSLSPTLWSSGQWSACPQQMLGRRPSVPALPTYLPSSSLMFQPSLLSLLIVLGVTLSLLLFTSL